MSDTSDQRPTQSTRPQSDKEELQDIPVDELVRITRELTQRITNLDRQRLARDLKEKPATIQTNAPITLQQFFTGEIDLDSELAKRFANAPLMSQLRLRPKEPKPLMENRRAAALMSTQDNSSQLSFDMDIRDGSIEITFTLGSMLAFHFDIGAISNKERQRWLDLMRRESGIAFFWGDKRWDNDYAIFVVRENFARAYAFSPTRRIDAAARMTPDLLLQLLDWLEAFWFPEHEITIAPPKTDMSIHIPGATVSGDYSPGSIKDTGEIPISETPLAQSFDPTIPHPDRPELQWDEPPTTEEDSSEEDSENLEW